jgi:D-alanyl-lipoteichoic acid acyltransferase DltB (MBOAT superfamily)
VVIADTLAPMIDYAFSNPQEVSGAVSLVAILAFAIQIYGDFAGYTLIARGVSRLMGIHLMENFRAPYLASSPRDFWHRWHISLSTWLREYLYFPLGGSRFGRFRTYLNLMITMLLGGLWHGARWNFVLWGFYHGLLLVGTHALNQISYEFKNKRWKGAQIAITFGFTLFGWLLFRVHDMGHLAIILENITTRFYWTPDLIHYLKPTLGAFVLLMGYHIWQERTGNDLILLQTSKWFQLGIYSFIIFALVTIRFQAVPFVYFQF